jgi:hypothetical protein
VPANLKDALAEAGLVQSVEVEAAEPADEPDALMQICSDQFTVGMVVLDLDPIMLLEDKRVTFTRPNPPTRSGPFLCVGVERSGYCSWTGITTSFRWERLELRTWWRLGGGARWRDSNNYLTDAGSVWRGPAEAFAAASWRETFTDPEDLPRLTEHGLSEVHKRMATERGRREAPQNRFGAGRRGA